MLAVSSASGSGLEELRSFSGSSWRRPSAAGDPAATEDLSEVSGYWEFMDDE